MTTPTPNLALLAMDPNMLQPATAHNGAMQTLDAVAQLAVETTTNTPPTTSDPADLGRRWIVGAAPTGAWAGQAGKVALCVGANLWAYLTPKEGWAAYDRGADVWRDYDGSAWSQRISARGAEFAGMISGLKLEWLSTTSLRVTSGTAHVEGLGRMLAVPSAITKSSLSLSANTWYHVYLYVNAGAADLEIVTTAPATAYVGTARSKTGDTARRYLGSVRAGTGGALLNFRMTGTRVVYLVDNITAIPNRVLAGGSATARTTLDLSAAVPVTAYLAFLGLVNLDATQSFRIDNSETGSTGLTTGLLGIGAGNRLYADIACDASQDIVYYYVASPSGGNAYIDVMGYTFER